MTHPAASPLLIAMAAAAAAALLAATPARAQYCEGTVHGLSSDYDAEAGTGFLAIRAKPKASSHQRGELLNGDTVEIFNRKGNWYRIATASGDLIEGWAHARWISNSCPY